MAPKKGKVNKLAKMSDEERARYLQHRADIEEEARRRKQELISRFLNNKLQKEEVFSKTNTAKLNQSWRYILRRIKCKQMALEIQGLVSTFDFMMDRKNNLLKSLMKAIDEADEQHRRMTQAHMENVNYFLEISTERLTTQREEYDTQKNAILEGWDREYTELAGNTERAELKLRLLLFQQSRDATTQNQQRELMMATAKNDAKLMQEEEIHDLTRPKELELESYWNQLRGVYVAYLDQHNPIINHYNSLREKDDFYRRDIARNTDKIACMQEVLLSLQNEWARSSVRLASRLGRLQAAKEEATRRYWQLKRSSQAERARAEEQLAVVVNASEDAIEEVLLLLPNRTQQSSVEVLTSQLWEESTLRYWQLKLSSQVEWTRVEEQLAVVVNSSDNAIETLEKVKNKLEKIQQMALICSKYETEEERTMAVPHSAHACEQPELDEYRHLDEDMIAECEELRKLDRFLLKVNRVWVQTVCLRGERDQLARENEQLKGYMRKQLTELALQSGRPRTVSTKVYRSDAQKIEAINLRSSWDNRPVTCVEGALCNAVQHEKRMKILEARSKALGGVRAYPRVCWQHP